jgi:hypothetical protein
VEIKASTILYRLKRKDTKTRMGQIRLLLACAIEAKGKNNKKYV